MAHIAWTGKGWILPLTAFTISLLTEFVVESVMQDDKYYQTHGLPIASVLWANAAIAFAISLWIYKEPTQDRFDDFSAQPRPGRFDHSFLFVPITFWPAILIVAGAVMLAVNGV